MSFVEKIKSFLTKNFGINFLICIIATERGTHKKRPKELNNNITINGKAQSFRVGSAEPKMVFLFKKLEIMKKELNWLTMDTEYTYIEEMFINGAKVSETKKVWVGFGDDDYYATTLQWSQFAYDEGYKYEEDYGHSFAFLTYKHNNVIFDRTIKKKKINN